MRQDEAELIRAVNQLCDGNPDQQTEDFLRSLSRPLADDTGVLRLFGTNFDTAYVNQISLDAAPGREYTFKSKDEGLCLSCLSDCL